MTPVPEGLAALRAAWPARVSWAAVKAVQPRVWRSAIGGAGLAVLAAAVSCVALALTTEWPTYVELPAWLNWARGLLSVTSVATSFLLWVFAWILLSVPGDTRRAIALEEFAEATGLRFARFGVPPVRRGIFFAEQLPGPRDAAPVRRLPGANPPAPLFRSQFVLWQSVDSLDPEQHLDPDMQLGIANYSGDKDDPKGPRHSFRFLSLRLPRELPHIMIDARGNGSLSSLLPGAQRLSLEGDFDRYFSVYVPSGYERDALELLTPDVMACLIDYGRGWDIEVIDDRLLLASSRVRGRSDRAQVPALVHFAGVVGGELGHQAATYTDPRAVRPRVAVAAAGRRLRRRSGVWFTVAAALVIAALLFSPFLLGWFLDR